MHTPEEILTLLRGVKTFDGVSWHIYDAVSGTELATILGPKIWAAVHGTILTQAAIATQAYLASLGNTYNPTDAGVSGRRIPMRDHAAENLNKLHKANEKIPQVKVEDYNLTRLHDEDALVADFIVALVTKGFMNGYIQSN